MSKSKKIVYDFAKEFTQAPGPRKRFLGDHSGEQFREDVLKPLLERYESVDIDGSGIKTSFNPSFLDEAFGVLAKEMGADNLLKRVKLFSDANPKLEEKFENYVKVDKK